MGEATSMYGFFSPRLADCEMKSPTPPNVPWVVSFIPLISASGRKAE
jgi:hypothetical protein